jgi:hypothetical protein
MGFLMEVDWDATGSMVFFIVVFFLVMAFLGAQKKTSLRMQKLPGI